MENKKFNEQEFKKEVEDLLEGRAEESNNNKIELEGKDYLYTFITIAEASFEHIDKYAPLSKEGRNSIKLLRDRDSMANINVKKAFNHWYITSYQPETMEKLKELIEKEYPKYFPAQAALEETQDLAKRGDFVFESLNIETPKTYDDFRYVFPLLVNYGEVVEANYKKTPNNEQLEKMRNFTEALIYKVNNLVKWADQHNAQNHDEIEYHKIKERIEKTFAGRTKRSIAEKSFLEEAQKLGIKIQ